MTYDPEHRLPTIYGYAHPLETGDVLAIAVAEDGTYLASHLSSNEVFASADLFMNTLWEQYLHEKYVKHYPLGYKTEWVPSHEMASHAGLQAALEKYRAAHKEQ